MSWHAAHEYCTRKGMKLATIRSVDENKYVSDACQGECWIGADRGNAGDEFGWSDESPMVYANWVPNVQEKRGLCAQMSGTEKSKWVGSDCESNLPFVCQTVYDFQLKLSVDESNVFGNKIIANKTDMISIWLMIGVILLVVYLVVQFYFSFEKSLLAKNTVVSDRTPLLEKVIA